MAVVNKERTRDTKLSDDLTEILCTEKGISDIALALYRSMESDEQEYTDALYLLWRLLSDQCKKITDLLEGINYNEDRGFYQEECQIPDKILNN